MIGILKVDTFYNKRPAMITFNEDAVQTAINSSESLLDSECNGLISRVWLYNHSTTSKPDVNNPLFRTDWELSQIVEAMVAQVQFTLNLGNDFTQGGESFGAGGLNASFSRPSERQVISPAVYKLLQNARVYNLQFFAGDSNNESNENDENSADNILSNAIARLGDIRYLEKYQGEAQKGNVAFIDSNNVISFGNPSALHLNSIFADRIKDPSSNDYKTIDKVQNLAFYGKDLEGTYSTMTRKEIIDLVNRENMSWNESLIYQKNSFVRTVINDPKHPDSLLLQTYIALKDNIASNPADSPECWKKVNYSDFDFDAVVNVATNKIKNLKWSYDDLKGKLDFDDFLKNSSTEYVWENILSALIDETQDNAKGIADSNTTIENIKNNELNFLKSELNKLNTKLNNLENKNLMEYMGEWVSTNVYSRGEVVSFNSDMWISKVDNNNAPISDSTKWQLFAANISKVNYKSIVFNNGTIYWFKTIDEFNALVKNKYNLQENVDYEIQSNWGPVGYGTRGINVGDNMLRPENIPRLDAWGNVWGSNDWFRTYWAIPDKGLCLSWSSKQRITVGNQNPVPICPRYLEVFAVKFLKDIYASDMVVK